MFRYCYWKTKQTLRKKIIFCSVGPTWSQYEFIGDWCFLTACDFKSQGWFQYHTCRIAFKEEEEVLWNGLERWEMESDSWNGFLVIINETKKCLNTVMCVLHSFLWLFLLFLQMKCLFEANAFTCFCFRQREGCWSHDWTFVQNKCFWLKSTNVSFENSFLKEALCFRYFWRLYYLNMLAIIAWTSQKNVKKPQNLKKNKLFIFCLNIPFFFFFSLYRHDFMT